MYSIETKQPDTDYVLQFKFLRPLSAVSAEYGRYRQVFFFLSYHTALHGRCVFVRTSSRRLPVYADWRRPEVGPQHEKQLPYCWWDVIRASISLVHVIRVVLNKNDSSLRLSYTYLFTFKIFTTSFQVKRFRFLLFFLWQGRSISPAGINPGPLKSNLKHIQFLHF